MHSVINYNMILKRDISANVQQALRVMPVVVVSGPRQSGKSTLLQNDPALAGRRYYTLDDPVLLSRALREPDLLLEGDEPLTIDEAQRAPKLLLAIKRAVDRNRIPGRFLLSGSANFLLLRRIAESLAGRVVYLRLGPMSRHELKGAPGEPLLIQLLRGEAEVEKLLVSAQPSANPSPGDWLAGGFPTVCLNPLQGVWRPWFTGYQQTYLERDLRDLAHVADLGLFEQFIQIMALRSAQVLNLHDIARDCGSNATTVSRWLRILETGFLGQRLPPYFSNRVKRLVKAPKWYLTDSGLMSFLAGLEPDASLDAHPLRGPLFETYMMQNMASMLDAYLPEARLLHYRSHTGHEVDFVVETPRAVLAVEVKASTEVDARDLKGLSALVSAEPRCLAGLVAYHGSVVRTLGPKMWAVPTGMLLG